MGTPSGIRPARYTWAEARYPYLVIRLVPDTYSLRPLPADLDFAVIRALGWSAMQATGYQLPMSLALGRHLALCLDPDGTERLEASVRPEGTLIDFDPPSLGFLPAPAEPPPNRDDGTEVVPPPAPSTGPATLVTSRTSSLYQPVVRPPAPLPVRQETDAPWSGWKWVIWLMIVRAAVYTIGRWQG
jgi:hypothetical protein